MTQEDFFKGQIVEFTESSGYYARKGDKAIVTAVDESYVYVAWIPENGQDNGGYFYDSFKPVE